MPQPRPQKDSTKLARDSARLLAALRNSPSHRLQLVGKNDTLAVPDEAMQLFAEILAQLAEGNVVRILGLETELTTQEAADLLHVSRPFLVQLLEKGALPFRKVGSHRRVRYQDVVDYKVRDDAERRKALDELTKQAQELNLGYD